MLHNFFRLNPSLVDMILISLPVVLLVFLSLMWKYATWNRPIKFLVTLPYAIVIFIVIFIIIKELIFSKLSPPPTVIINQSQYFDCKPVNEQWGRCKSLENNVSFEYPANWKYIDDGIKGIGFSPSEEKLKKGEGPVLTFEPSPSGLESTEAAKEAIRSYIAKRYPELNYTEKEVNGFYIIDWTFRYPSNGNDALFVSINIIADKMVYRINSGSSYEIVSEEELYSVSSHMIKSLKKE